MMRSDMIYNVRSYVMMCDTLAKYGEDMFARY